MCKKESQAFWDVFLYPTHLHVKVLFNKRKEKEEFLSAVIYWLLCKCAFPVEFTIEVSWKEYFCPSGALAVSRGKGWVLSYHTKWSLCFWLENFHEPFMWLLAWPCQRQVKTYLWSSLKFPQAIQINQGGVPNRKGGFTTCHSRDTSENSVNLPRKGIFSHRLPSKSEALPPPPPPTGDPEKSLARV